LSVVILALVVLILVALIFVVKTLGVVREFETNMLPVTVKLAPDAPPILNADVIIRVVVLVVAAFI
jgi:hypothetical protein